MSSHFPIPWPGNKRREVDKILARIPAGRFTTIVEPFAGTAAVSFAIWQREEDCGAQFVVNDIDPYLCNFYRRLRSDGLDSFNDWVRPRLNVDDYKAIKSRETPNPLEWYYAKKVRPGIYERGKVPAKWPTLKVNSIVRDYERFVQLSRMEVVNGDWASVVGSHLSNPDAVIYLDPPYFSSHNQDYYGMLNALDKDTNRALDHTGMFVAILKTFEKSQASVVLSTNSCAILRHLYSKWVVQVYEHAYGHPFLSDDGTYKARTTEHLLAVKKAEVKVDPLTDVDFDAVMSTFE